MKIPALFLAVPAVLALLPARADAQVGSVLRAQKINEFNGGFTGPLHHDDYFGWSLAPLGDLDGNGAADLAVGAFLDDDGGVDRGAIWILFLNTAGNVVAEQKISQTQGGFTGTLSDGARLGRAIAAVGDLDGDGLTELVVPTMAPKRIWILFLNANGTVRSHAILSYQDPVFVPAPERADFDDSGLAALGDVDGDGLGDFAIGASYDDDGATNSGAVWIVRLNADGSGKAAQKISQTSGGFPGGLEAGARFGWFVGAVGDLDGDGNPELAVSENTFITWILFLDAGQQVRTARELTILDLGLDGMTGTKPWTRLGDLDADGIPELAAGVPTLGARGGVVETYLRADGTVRKRLVVTHQRGGLGSLPNGTYFGMSPVPLGDLDGDGGIELAVGAPIDHDAGGDRGAAWILFLDPSAARNGTGANPLTLSQAAEPVIGAPWNATLDCSAHASRIAYLAGWPRPLSGVFLSAGELLVDPAGPRFFGVMAGHAGGPVPFSAPVPNDPALVDLQVFFRGCAPEHPGSGSATRST